MRHFSIILKLLNESDGFAVAQSGKNTADIDPYYINYHCELMEQKSKRSIDGYDVKLLSAVFFDESDEPVSLSIPEHDKLFKALQKKLWCDLELESND